MTKIEEILNSNRNPKEKQTQLVQAVITDEIPATDFVAYFESAGKVNKGTCADAMKHISAARPDLMAPYMDILIKYINDPLPRVKWGIPEAIGNLAKDYPEEAAHAIPYLLKNTTDDKNNTTVIRWCAAFALGEIAKNNPATREELLSTFETILRDEQNSGVRNAYLKTIRAIKK